MYTKSSVQLTGKELDKVILDYQGSYSQSVDKLEATRRENYDTGKIIPWAENQIRSLGKVVAQDLKQEWHTIQF